MSVPSEASEPEEFEAVFVGGRPLWQDVLLILVAILWTVGAIGGVWYLCHRIDQATINAMDEALSVERVFGGGR